MSSLGTLRDTLNRHLLDLWYGTAPSPDDAYGSRVSWGDEGCAIARQTLAAEQPCLIARFGSTELACVNYFTRWRARRAVSLPPSVCWIDNKRRHAPPSANDARELPVITPKRRRVIMICPWDETLLI